LAEVVKYGVAFDAELFEYLERNTSAVLSREPAVERHLIARCCRLKADVVEQDEREETGLRALLNYGHTFAHAFETIGGYGNWLHGEAVAAGMVCASRLADRLGFVSAEVTERQRKLLETFRLPIRPLDWPVDGLLATMRNDKKSIAGRMRFVLPRGIGAAELVDDVSPDDVRQVLVSFSS
jgi:3-dehydroquinate synthase